MLPNHRARLLCPDELETGAPSFAAWRGLEDPPCSQAVSPAGIALLDYAARFRHACAASEACKDPS
eukprot:4675509-Pleurochrysis_carterae.AAC.2